VGGTTHSAKEVCSFIALNVIYLLSFDASKSAAFHQFCALSF